MYRRFAAIAGVVIPEHKYKTARIPIKNNGLRVFSESNTRRTTRIKVEVAAYQGRRQLVYCPSSEKRDTNQAHAKSSMAAIPG